LKSSAKKVELASVDDLFSTEESRADAQRERVLEIPLSELHPFKNHPFKVKDDESMMETADSIRQYGVLVPAIGRPDPEGGYELVAGHRRHRASELAEKETMPVIVRDLDDDAATIIMVDSNLQRESLLPSERAFVIGHFPPNQDPHCHLKMLNETMLTRPISEEQRQEFLQATGSQLDNLEFLIQAMVKTSRLETGVITLKIKDAPIEETLVTAINGVLAPMEKKGIELTVDCPEGLTISHDSRWTSEALFNLLDNAVKYTSAGGSIHVSVQNWEMYWKIDVTDTGRGIPEQEQATIFKRFYREEAVHEVDGIGIGLYLAREIITMQGGYILVTSEVGKGSTLSVFLPQE